MGTRASTIVKDEGTVLVNLWRQFDGYPSGHGKELKDFLSPIELVNGLGYDTTDKANGMSCLAAQIVAHFKTAPGEFYLETPISEDEYAKRLYVYEVYEKDEDICLKVFYRGKKQYDGSVKDYNPEEKGD